MVKLCVGCYCVVFLLGVGVVFLSVGYGSGFDIVGCLCVDFVLLMGVIWLVMMGMVVLFEV